MSENMVIVGAGHAAGQAVTTLRQKGFAGSVILIGEEPYVPYQRPPLSKKFLAGELELDRLYFKPERYYPEHDVELRPSTRAESIDRVERLVRLDDGSSVRYDHLLLTTGSEVRRMQVPGSELDRINYLRTIHDVQQIQSMITEGARLVIVGAGYIGMEVAAVAVSKGMDVTVLEMEERVMKRVVGPSTSSFFEGLHRAAGIDLRFGHKVESFQGTKQVEAVVCEGGHRFDADLVVIGIGIRPRTELAEAAGIACNDGIIVDAQCRTEDARILAAGDCANHPNSILGRRARLESVHSALEQAKIAATTICGEEAPEVQAPWFWSDQYDIKLQIVGLSQGYDQIIVRGVPESKSFAAFYLADGKLLAVDAINSPREFMLAKKLVAHGARFDAAELENEDNDFKELAKHALAESST